MYINGYVLYFLLIFLSYKFIYFIYLFTNQKGRGGGGERERERDKLLLYLLKYLYIVKMILKNDTIRMYLFYFDRVCMYVFFEYVSIYIYKYLNS